MLTLKWFSLSVFLCTKYNVSLRAFLSLCLSVCQFLLYIWQKCSHQRPHHLELWHGSWPPKWRPPSLSPLDSSLARGLCWQLSGTERHAVRHQTSWHSALFLWQRLTDNGCWPDSLSHSFHRALGSKCYHYCDDENHHFLFLEHGCSPSDGGSGAAGSQRCVNDKIL